MKKIKQLAVRMTKKEKENYDNLSNEEKRKFEKKLIEKKQKITFLSVLLSQLMLENIDEMENFGLVNNKLKITTRQFKIQISNFLNKVFKNDKIKSDNIDVLTEISNDIEKLIGNHYNIIHNKIEKEDEKI